MLLRVAIAPEIEQDVVRRVAWGPRVLKRLNECAVLTTESDAAAAALLAVLRRLGQSESTTAFAELIWRRRENVPADLVLPALHELLDLDAVREWGAVADLLVLSQAHVELLEDQDLPEAPELSDFRGILNSAAMERVEGLWSEPVPKGTSREEVWRSRLGPLAKRATTVTIVDRYAGKQLLRSFQDDRLGGTRRPPNGPRWFLNHLSDSQVRQLQFTTSAQAVRNAGFEVATADDQIVAFLRRRNRQANVSVNLVDGDFPHQRLIAFDRWIGFSFHNGLESFNDVRLSEPLAINASPALAREVGQLQDHLCRRARR